MCVYNDIYIYICVVYVRYMFNNFFLAVLNLLHPHISKIFR